MEVPRGSSGDGWCSAQLTKEDKKSGPRQTGAPQPAGPDVLVEGDYLGRSRLPSPALSASPSCCSLPRARFKQLSQFSSPGPNFQAILLAGPAAW